MEKNIKVETYMTLNEEGIKNTKKEAKEEAVANEYDEGELVYPDTKWEVDELYFNEDDETLTLNGEFFSNGKKIGYLSPSIKLGNETVIKIIEHYMDKLDKLKTVMEAIK